jgi:hypothetical protein
MTDEELDRLLDEEGDSHSVRWKGTHRLADVVRANR